MRSSKYLWLFALLLFALPAKASDIFFANAAAGANDGTSCANAYAWTDVTHGINNINNWISGNVLHLCGTITAASAGTNGIISQAAGLSGSPITIKFETGAILQSPRWPGAADGPVGCGGSAAGGAIEIFHDFIIIDGGTNGIIQNTANGTGLANSASSVGIWHHANSFILRNLTVRNIYVRTVGLDDNGGCSADLYENSTGGHSVICNNTLNNGYFGAELIYGDTTSVAPLTALPSCASNAFPADTLAFFFNTLVDHTHHIQPSGQGAPLIYGNDISNWTNWNGDANMHSAGMFVTGTSRTLFFPQIVANFVHGDLASASPTGFIYLTYNPSIVGSGNSANIFRNILYGTGSTVTCCQGFAWQNQTNNAEGPYKVYYNTIINTGFQNESYGSAASPTFDFRGNIFWANGNSQNAYFYHNQNTPWTFSTLTADANDYFVGRAFGPFGGFQAPASFATWKTNCVAGGGALCDANSIVSSPALASEASFAAGGSLTDGTGFYATAGTPSTGGNLSAQCATTFGLCITPPQTFGVGGSCGTGCVATPPSLGWNVGAYQFSVGSLGFSPSPANFGNQAINTTSAQLTVTVTNNTGATWTAGSTYFTITGTNPGDFANAGTGTCANLTPVAPGANCTVKATFTPSAGGTRTAVLTIQGTVNGTVNLTGNGLAPAVLLSPTNIAFGNQNTGTSSPNHAVTLTNNGAAILHITSIVSSDAAHFPLNTNTCGATLAVGASCGFNAVFSPAIAGAISANVVLTTDAGTSPDNLPMTGTGITPITVTITVLPNPVLFGNQIQNVTSQPQTVTVTSTGTGNEVLNTPAFTITGTNASDFAAGNGCDGHTLAPTNTCTISVTCKPSLLGLETANLNISGTVNGTVQLTCSGIAAPTTPAPAPVIFVGAAFPQIGNVTLSGPCAMNNKCTYLMSCSTCSNSTLLFIDNSPVFQTFANGTMTFTARLSAGTHSYFAVNP